MTVAKLAYLTSPAPDRYLLNIQIFGSDELLRFEIAECHLANIVCDGASFALRKHHRVPETNSQESANVRTDNRAQ